MQSIVLNGILNFFFCAENIMVFMTILLQFALNFVWKSKLWCAGVRDDGVGQPTPSRRLPRPQENGG